jgi:uncharacterized protein (DUF1015 family)
MPRIAPFTGLVYDPDVVGPLAGVTAPPYDVIGREAHDAFLRSSPYNIVRVDLGEGDGAPDKYRNGSRLLREWRAAGVLMPPAAPVLYAYDMRFRLEGRDRSIRGLVCAMEIEDWGGSVLPHERVMSGPVDDRLAQMRATHANLSPVYGTIAGPADALAEVLDRAAARPPLAGVTDEQGVAHRLWEVGPDDAVERAVDAERLLIADGHHRYTTALRYRDEMRAASGPGPWDRIMTLIIDATTEEPPVLPFHRIVRAGAPPAEGTRVRDLQEVLAELDDAKLVYGSAVLESGRMVHRVAELDGSPPTVRALHDQVLDPAVTDAAEVTFTEDAVAAEGAVRDGDAEAAYFLPPTTADRILAVVERGERLPQKSTFFWPKPRTGMVIRLLDLDR